MGGTTSTSGVKVANGLGGDSVTDDKPNLVILTVGHTGSTVITRMLGVLGWNLQGCDPEYAENETIRRINHDRISRKIRKGFDAESAGEVLKDLRQPWVLKDPRFVFTLRAWWSVMREYEPYLIWLQRDPQAILDSWQRRHYRHAKSHVGWRLRRARRAYQWWPDRKVILRYEDVCEAAAMFRAPIEKAWACSP